MDYQLVIVRGRSASATIKLGDGVTTVGRHDDCQLRIKSSQVSRKHCELFEKKGLLLVKDLGSANGTYVNGRRIQDQRVLEPGDELTIGQVTLKIAKAAAGAAQAASAGGKPGDTAVSQAAPIAVSDDVFDIDFDDATAVPAAEPTPPPAPAKAPARETKPAATKAAEPAPEIKPNLDAEDAVADFLLDLKFDDE